LQSGQLVDKPLETPMKCSTLMSFLSLTLAAAGAFAQSPSAAAASTPATGAGNQPQPVVMLVPVQVSSPALEAGCWAQFYDERNFKGDMLTLVGPIEVGDFDKSSGRHFKRNIDSLVLGPKATLTVYEHQMFKDKSVKFQSNAREGGLVKKLGFGGRIESMRLECGG
jgi:hypothetical protein